MAMRKIRVLVVDDSPLMRRLLTDLINSDPMLEVIDAAADPLIAREKIKQLNPDVLTLDIEMPHMDGLTFLRNLMHLRPMPVVMVSTLTAAGAGVTLEALDLGAVDFVSKPRFDTARRMNESASELITKIKIAANANVRPLTIEHIEKLQSTNEKTLLPLQANGHRIGQDRIIAVGASTGGTEAIREVLWNLGADSPGIVIVQHIPRTFSTAFANRLDQSSSLRVCEAQDGQGILPGHAFVAPGDCHLVVVRAGERFRCKLVDAPPVAGHRPSVDVLFRSVAECAGGNALGIILTGMGKDGAEGLKAMRHAGAHTIAQDEQTSVVWGMPGAAVKLGAVEKVLPLNRVADELMCWSARR